MMLERLRARGAAIGEAAVKSAIARLARAADVPRDVRLEITESGLVLSGRRLVRRMLDDARLRRIGR